MFLGHAGVCACYIIYAAEHVGSIVCSKLRPGPTMLACRHQLTINLLLPTDTFLRIKTRFEFEVGNDDSLWSSSVNNGAIYSANTTHSALDTIRWPFAAGPCLLWVVFVTYMTDVAIWPILKNIKKEDDNGALPFITDPSYELYLLVDDSL